MYIVEEVNNPVLKAWGIRFKIYMNDGGIIAFAENENDADSICRLLNLKLLLQPLLHGE